MTAPALVRVLIAGGGVAGLEALLALRDLAGPRVELTLLSPEREFVYRPMAVAEPFGRGRADRYPLSDIASDLHAELIRASLVEVDHANRLAVTDTGKRLPYDALLIAVGTSSRVRADRPAWQGARRRGGVGGRRCDCLPRQAGRHRLTAGGRRGGIDRCPRRR